MPDRKELTALFLARNGWGNATRTHLAGDASNRSYQRLHRADTQNSAILMDAPPNGGETIRPFIKITRYLHSLHLSAPQILAKDEQNGFLVIEDLGNALFADLAKDSPEQEHELYSAAVDFLVELHQHNPPKNLLDYSPAVMAEYITPIFEWYHPASPDQMGAISAELETVLAKFCADPPVIALRDFHAENLLWLPQRAGIKRVGLLDYQDAVLAHPAYDLASLLKDARRDVPDALQAAMIDRYILATDADDQSFRAALSAQSAQRNLRIIGVFARLCVVEGKPDYIDLIPRVWSNLKQDLSHPELAKLATLVHKSLPDPTPDILQRLKSKCANPPTP